MKSFKVLSFTYSYVQLTTLAKAQVQNQTGVSK